MRLDRLVKVAKCQNHLLDTRVFEQLQVPLEHCPSTELQEALRHLGVEGLFQA
jgi:hypothetical protein